MALRVKSPQLRIHVPYQGERIFFSLRPDRFSTNPPRAKVTKSELLVTFEDRKLNGVKVKNHLNRQLSEIEKWLGWSRAMADRHNHRILAVALGAIAERKQRLLNDRRTVAELGIPVRRRGDAPIIPVPVGRKRATIAKPTPSEKKYEPEPALIDGDYEAAIGVLLAASKQLERSPSTTLAMNEEQRRDHMLVALNGCFEGQAGGEVFNGAGKTDILLRVDDRNVFIAECKIWRGATGFGKAIDQLLGYLVWRDTKAVLILFIESKNATQAIQRAVAVLREHPQCLHPVPGGSADERLDFVFISHSDSSREIRMAFLPVVIAAPPETG